MVYKVFASGMLCAEVEAASEADAALAFRTATLKIVDNRAELRSEGPALPPGVYNLRVLEIEVELDDIEEMSDDELRSA